MRRILAIVSLIPALITGILCTLGSNGEFFNLMWLMPLSGAIAGMLHKPLLLPCHLGIAAFFMLLSGIITDGLYPLSLDLLLMGGAAVFEIIGYSIGAFVIQIYRGRIGHRIGAGVGTLLLLAILFIPVNAVFGNPISAMIAKQQLDGCMEAHVDPERYSVDSFGYDWYNGNYRYRLTNTVTGERENLTLYEHKDSIYFSGTGRVYENLWN